MSKPGAKYWKFIFLISIFLVSCLLVFPQFKIRIQLNEIPPSHPGDSIFVAGNFNNWNPSAAGYHFEKNGAKVALEIDGLAASIYQFKFTRGSWEKVETKTSGSDVENHTLALSSDTLIEYSISGWKDDFAPVAKRHTVSRNVRILDSAFLMPQLTRTRRIWLYLPPGYKTSKKRYPVMYMQDGQNIFDEYTAAFGEWGVDECVDSMIAKGRAACIIVGIDNGPNRMTEYNPDEFRDFGKGEGDQYVDFLAQTLKPYIDKHYRTLPSKLNTIVAGSSMGGLIAYYAMLKYPAVFGKGGIFSPAFWTADKIKDLTVNEGKNVKGKLFFYMGKEEGENYVADMKDVTDELGKHSPALIYAVVDPVGLHNENAWRKWFPEFYAWIMADGFNNVIKVEN